MALPLLFGCADNVSSSALPDSEPSSSIPSEDSSSLPSYEPQDIASRDVSYPTDIPLLGEESIQIHYRRSDNKYADWGLWIWDFSSPNTDDSLVDPFNYQDDFGVVASYPISKFGTVSGRKIGFIIRKLATWDKDVDPDLIFDLEALKADNNGVHHVYVFSGDTNLYSSKYKTKADQITTCEFIDISTIKVVGTHDISEYYLYENGELIARGLGMNKSSFEISMPKSSPKALITSVYTVECLFKNSGETLSSGVSVAKLYKDPEFIVDYAGELGAIYSKSETVFRVWSPVSSSIKLRLYEKGTPKSVSATLGDDAYSEIEMRKDSLSGVFEATVSGDLEGKYYTYVVSNGRYSEKEIVDPYAKSAGINGLRGMVVDFSKTNPTGWDEMSPIQYNRNELTVWETHVADVTSHSSWTGNEANRRKFAGMHEAGTTYTRNGVTVTTGFDHIKELGVNAVQILPMFDQANDETEYHFNWGYNPLNYNVVEGLYSSDPYDGYARIAELKALIKDYHDAGINIIMDVVYNHVNAADASNFDVLMPGYYFRYNADGSYSNGSGCGNETASEMPMMRKFIIDSASFWAKEYKLGGFRFDLMGLHDLTTMNELAASCKEINPAIVIYGEPWAGGSSSMENYNANSAKQSNGNKYQGYGQFNDQMRDALIKGGLNATSAKGWITNNETINQTDVRAILKGMAGSTYNSAYEIADPNKTVNYVTCHDNYTLFDRIDMADAASSITEQKQMATLANAIVLTSQGTSFLLGGEEMARTKHLNGNSYNEEAGDRDNQYSYARKITYSDLFENYKKLIAFKQDTTALHGETCSLDVKSLSNGKILSYEMASDDKTYRVVHTNGVPGKEEIDLSGYSVYLDTLGKASGALGKLTLEPYQTIIAIKD